MARPRTSFRQYCMRWTQNLSTASDRLLYGGSDVIIVVDSAMNWAFGSYWQKFESWISGVCSTHPNVEIVLFLLVILPLLMQCCLVGVFVVAWEEGVWAMEKLKRWWSQPGRTLLREREIAKRKKMRLVRDEVEALPKMRPRALTLRSDGRSPAFKEESRSHDGSHVRQRTVDQLEACELWRFPFEVREQIWKYAVGGNHVHIVKRRQRWGSVYCPAKDPTDPVHRDLCTRRDEDGYHVTSAWPRDMRPLALLVSCRQIYSECIDFLYSQNTFAFDDPAWFHPFLGSLLRCRARLIKSFHLAPVFAREWSHTGSGHLAIAHQPSVPDTICHLAYVLNRLRIHPEVRSLTITPKLELNFTSACDASVCDFVSIFTHELSLLGTSTPITLAWPEDPATYTPPFIVRTTTNYWGQAANLPPEGSRNFEIREMPWQSPTDLLGFFTPFDVQCLHCASYTIIRRATKGCAEVSFLPLSMDSIPPETTTISRVLVRYWTFHVFCGGWIEFQYHGERKEWSVTQGAQRISAEEADRHLAGKEGLERQYPPVENAHERLRGIAVKDVAGESPPRRWSYVGSRSSTVIDEPTREAYYRNVGWGRGRVHGKTEAT